MSSALPIERMISHSEVYPAPWSVSSVMVYLLSQLVVAVVEVVRITQIFASNLLRSDHVRQFRTGNRIIIVISIVIVMWMVIVVSKEWSLSLRF